MRYIVGADTITPTTIEANMLEPYTVAMNYTPQVISNDNNSNNKNDVISEALLNCVNAKKPIGFYGNCMLLPFTYPESLANKLGKTAAEIQDELYRYHTTNYRVPSTVISIPTNGMVGEAVLGATNVSEKIDITRFWNWKDSEIDHINIDQSSLNGHSLLDNADTKSVQAPTTGVTATQHIDGNNLMSRGQPEFANALANTDIRDLLKSTDTNASTGRESIVAANTDVMKSAISAATDIAKSAVTSGISSLAGIGDTDIIKSALGSLGLEDTDIKSLADKITSGNLSVSDLLQSLVNNNKEGGKSNKNENENNGDDEGDSDDDDSDAETLDTDIQNNDSLNEFINRAIEAIKSESSAVSFFNDIVASDSGNQYSLDEINKLADAICQIKGLDLETVLNQIKNQ